MRVDSTGKCNSTKSMITQYLYELQDFSQFVV